MLNRETAATTASQHLNELIPTDGAPVLEEHFFADGVWQITLSYRTDDASATDTRVNYKAFAIDGRTGEVISMKIRTVKN